MKLSGRGIAVKHYSNIATVLFIMPIELLYMHYSNRVYPILSGDA